MYFKYGEKELNYLKKKDKIITNDNGPCSISGVLDDWWFGGK